LPATDTINVAVLLTCHNRCEETLECLRELYAQRLTGGVRLAVFLTDDGSSDRTAEAVAREFPAVQIVRGDGTLYWCKGMRVAWERALETGRFDYFLWLNNDTHLHSDALASLLAGSRENSGIIVGSCQDPESGRWTYGGRATPHGGKDLKSKPVEPCDRLQSCQLMNGNLVLIPARVVKSIGILSSDFTHALGDFDYGFRAMDAGFFLTVPPRYQAFCSRNPLPAWCDPATPFLVRLSLFNAPKGIHFSEYMTFCFRHFGPRTLWIGIKAVLRVIVPSLWLRKSDV